MLRLLSLLILGLLLLVPARADEPKPSTTTKATWLITGLHCPPCTKTVERSLQKVQGVRSVKVDWQNKTARVEYDEKALSVQKLSRSIAGTPHMMGGNLQYGGWLALRVPEMKDADAAKAVKAALSQVAGVKTVSPFPDRRSVSVQFGTEGDVTTEQLLEALKTAGFEASNL